MVASKFSWNMIVFLVEEGKSKSCYISALQKTVFETVDSPLMTQK